MTLRYGRHFCCFSMLLVAWVTPLDARSEAPSVEAGLKSVDQALSAGNRGQALLILEELARDHPDDPTTWLNLGQLRANLGDFEGATAAYQHGAALPGRLKALSTLQLAKTLRMSSRLRDADIALKETESLEASPALRELLRLERLALDESSRTTWPTTWRSRVELAGGWNSNYRYTGSSVAPRAAATGQVLLGTERKDRRASIQLQLNETAGLPEERLASMLGATEFELGDPRKLGLAIGPQLELETLGSALYFLRPGVNFRLGTHTARLGIQLLAGVTRNLSLRDDYLYLSGLSAYAQLLGSRRWRGSEFELSLGYSREITRELVAPGYVLPLSYQAISITLGWQWVPARGWQLRLSPSWTWSYFLKHEMPDDVRRIDLLIQAESRLERALGGTGSVAFLQLVAIVNQSSLGPLSISDRNYRQFRPSIGVSWSW